MLAFLFYQVDGSNRADPGPSGRFGLQFRADWIYQCLGNAVIIQLEDIRRRLFAEPMAFAALLVDLNTYQCLVLCSVGSSADPG